MLFDSIPHLFGVISCLLER